MITRAGAALMVALGLTLVAPTADAAGPTVSVADMQFTPAALTTRIGSTVTWRFRDSIAHTTTSAQGFWDSGAKSGGQTYARTFVSAGSFAYHCSFHPMMTGTVRVPVTPTGSSAHGWTLRWASSTGSGGTSYDVQVRRGTHAWKALRTHTTSPTAMFARVGTWSVRARSIRGSARSGWSPVVVVKTT